ncbi:Uncharacterised protein [Edwardsiella tarda]|nr:Uncharacterised protein [Edwardsiella tarda]STD50471.1 Uncharacterised protein [Edwardsiella tarda]
MWLFDVFNHKMVLMDKNKHIKYNLLFLFVIY